MIFGQDRYNKFSMLLHWMVAILVLVLICLGMFMHDIPKGDPDRAFFFNLHKSIGVTAGLIMFIRLWWRHKNPPPPLPSWLPMAGVYVEAISRLALRVSYWHANHRFFCISIYQVRSHVFWFIQNSPDGLK